MSERSGQLLITRATMIYVAQYMGSFLNRHFFYKSSLVGCRTNTFVSF